MVDRGWRGIRYSYVQVVVSPRLGDPPFSVQEALPLPYGKGSQESPRRSSLSDAAHPPQPDRSSPSLTADSNTSSTVRSDLSEAGRLRTMCASGVGQRWSTGVNSTQGRRKQHTRLRRVKPTMETVRLSTEWPPNAAGNGLLLCLMSSSLNRIYLINSCAS